MSAQPAKLFANDNEEKLCNIFRAETLAASAKPQVLPAIHLLTPSQTASSDKTDVLILLVTADQVAVKDIYDHPVVAKCIHAPNYEIPAVFHDFSGKTDETVMLYPNGAMFHGKKVERLLLVGLGDAKKVETHSYRLATNCIIKSLKAHKFESATIALPAFASDATKSTIHGAVDAISRISVLANHTFDKYLSRPKNFIKSLQVVLDESNADEQSCLTQAVTKGQVVVANTVFARELANDRADVIHPEYMEKIARQVADVHGLKITVVNEEELIAQGYNLITAVGQSARHKARIVGLEYRGAPERTNIDVALVGKGITFDTGGLNLKGTGNIENMHIDMAGSAAVLATIRAAASLNIPINMVSVLALAENSIDGLSYKPHAIIQSKKGSIEISNTDAEGRLALADAFSWVQSTYSNPPVMIDAATLTGAIVVALGEHLSGLYSNNDKLAADILASGKNVWERCWHMPLLPEYGDELKGTYSDFKSTGGRYGGPSIAAAFLQKFVEEGVEWAHLDIAGAGMHSKKREWHIEGGTGFGVQLLVDYLQQRAKSLQSK